MIRPTFLSFETAKHALNSSQLGLDTVGQNISNVNTPGYTRQRIDQVTINSSGYKTKFQVYGSQFPGQGSEVIGISQIRDPFLDKRYRTEAAACGEYSAVSAGLADINSIFDEITTTGLHAKMGEFLQALDQLILNAESKEHVTVLRNKVQQITQVMNKNSVELDNVETQQRDDLGYAIEDINNILQQIADLNGKIREDNFYGNPSNELNDKRNMLIDQLSEYVNIEVRHTPVKISDDRVFQSLSIVIKGSGNEKLGIPPVTLVDSSQYNGLGLDIDDATGEASIYLTDGLSGMPVMLYQADGSTSSDITGEISSGGLKGYLNILNGKGVFAGDGENSFRGIPYYRKAFDDYAQRFADTINDMNAQEVYGPDGLITSIPRQLLATNDGSEAFTAANIAVSDNWLNSSGYLETSKVNNALYTDKDGYLYSRDGDTMISTGIKYDQVAGIDKDGFLLGDDGFRLFDNYNANVNVDSLQRAITIETTLEDPTPKLEYYLDNPSGTQLYWKAKNPPYTPAFTIGITPIDDVDGVDEDGFLLKDGNRYLESITTGDGFDESFSGFDLKYYSLLAGTNEFTYRGSDGQPHPITLDIRKTYITDSEGFLMDKDGIRVRITDPVDPSQLTDVNAKDLLKYTRPVNVSELQRFKENNDILHFPGEPTPNGLLPGEAANDSLLSLKTTLTTSGDPYPNGFRGTFQEYLVGFQSDMALDKEQNDSLMDASYNVLTGLADSRDAVSAVNIDEEGINMMTYQNYYNAAARYMTVLDEALGTIIQGMGVVGR